MGSAGLADGHGDAEDGVGAQLALVLGAVQLEHDLVDLLLLNGVQAVLHQLRGDDVVHVVHRLCHGSTERDQLHTNEIKDVPVSDTNFAEYPAGDPV